MDRYWTRHTVNSVAFGSAQESLEYLEWRDSEYPLFREFSDHWGEHDGELIVDYGCGPGNDLTGFLVHTGARKVVGVDVSATALDLARQRLALHGVDSGRFELIQLSDASADTGLPDASADYTQSLGVLHHASDPLAGLSEMRRLLRPGGTGRVMVYNRDSVWLHLYVAYQKQIVEGLYPEMAVDEAFGKTTDGEDCPIALAYRPSEFGELLEAAGFKWEFLGGYLSKVELDCLRDHGREATTDAALGDEHRAFLGELSSDDDGNPVWRGLPAGVGAVYVIS